MAYFLISDVYGIPIDYIFIWARKSTFSIPLPCFLRSHRACMLNKLPSVSPMWSWISGDYF